MPVYVLSKVLGGAIIMGRREYIIDTRYRRVCLTTTGSSIQNTTVVLVNSK